MACKNNNFLVLLLAASALALVPSLLPCICAQQLSAEGSPPPPTPVFERNISVTLRTVYEIDFQLTSARVGSKLTDDEMQKLLARARPGVDYPTYSAVPFNNTQLLSCNNNRLVLPEGGVYADLATRCQVYHFCTPLGKRLSFLCPNMTIFDQRSLACNWWFEVDCNAFVHKYAKSSNKQLLLDLHADTLYAKLPLRSALENNNNNSNSNSDNNNKVTVKSATSKLIVYKQQHSTSPKTVQPKKQLQQSQQELTSRFLTPKAENNNKFSLLSSPPAEGATTDDDGKNFNKYRNQFYGLKTPSIDSTSTTSTTLAAPTSSPLPQTPAAQSAATRRPRGSEQSYEQLMARAARFNLIELCGLAQLHLSQARTLAVLADCLPKLLMTKHNSVGNNSITNNNTTASPTVYHRKLYVHMGVDTNSNKKNTASSPFAVYGSNHDQSAKNNNKSEFLYLSEEKKKEKSNSSPWRDFRSLATSAPTTTPFTKSSNISWEEPSNITTTSTTIATEPTFELINRTPPDNNSDKDEKIALQYQRDPAITTATATTTTTTAASSLFSITATSAATAALLHTGNEYIVTQQQQRQQQQERTQTTAPSTVPSLFTQTASVAQPTAAAPTAARVQGKLQVFSLLNDIENNNGTNNNFFNSSHNNRCVAKPQNAVLISGASRSGSPPTTTTTKTTTTTENGGVGGCHDGDAV